MKNPISDKDFCNEISISSLGVEYSKQFRTHLRNKQYKKAALFAANCLFATPFAHPIVEKDIPLMADLINDEVPEQIKYLEKLAKNYWLKPMQAIPATHSAYENANYHIPNTVQRVRGNAVYTLCRLTHLTGKDAYRKHAMKMMREICAPHGDYENGSSIGFYVWHPHTAGKNYSQNVAHIAQEFSMMLPFIRSQSSDEDKLYILKLLWTIADLSKRAFCKDQSFNLTLHFVTACNQCALLFPQFKQSQKWEQWANLQLQEFYDSIGVTSDGYFREGTVYQRVIHHLLEINTSFMKAAGRKVPKKLEYMVHAAHQLNADICSPDGFAPLIGDSAPNSPHEHWIVGHEALHLGAALENNRAFKDKAGTAHNRKAHERNLWDMGLRGLKHYLKMPNIADKDRIQKPADHSASGLQILGCGKDKKRHFGALIYTQNHNHAHFDVGSIHLYSKGRALISDPSKSSYGTVDDKDESAQSHSQAILPRFSPAGPRLHSQKWAKTKFVQHNSSWQAASMEHSLYEDFRIQRTLVLIDNSKDSGDTSYWIVLDKITATHPHPLGLHELVDTSFHFNAIETNLGINGTQCWSQHSDKRKTATRFKETDSAFAGPGTTFNLVNYRSTHEFSDSAANLQLAGFSLDNTEFSLEEYQSHTCEFSGRVKRPAALFRYRGPLPTVLAYVLVPFNGVKKHKPMTIEGSLTKNEFTAVVHGNSVKITNAFSKNIKIRR